jgi:uncharacterized protein YgiM (DUF1202 family)
MKNKTLMYALIAIPVLVGGYFILRSMRKRKEETPVPTSTPEPQKGGLNIVKTPETTVTTTSYQNYVVTTQTSNLNIRKQPSTSSAVIGSLNKGSKVLLKPSATSGWMEYSENGNTTVGYVASGYVTKA